MMTITKKTLPEDTKKVAMGETWSKVPNCFKPEELPCIVTHEDHSSSHYAVEFQMDFENYMMLLRRISYSAEGETVLDEIIAWKEITEAVRNKVDEAQGVA
jgi:hypothetical protein